MILNLKLSLPLCEPLFPQNAFPFRLNLREVELIHHPRDGQSELDVRDRLSDTAAGADGEWGVGVSGGFDCLLGGGFGEPTLGDE